MKLQQLFEKKDKEQKVKQAEEAEKTKGTYVGANLSKETIEKLQAIMKELKVPNPIPVDKFHTTIIFSRKPFEFEPLGKINPPWVGKPTGFDLFDARDGNKCLVLKYTCAKQKARHEYLMKTYDAQYDWPEYKLHLTLSYNAGTDFDITKYKPKDYIKEILIDEEYTTPLELEWLAKK